MDMQVTIADLIGSHTGYHYQYQHGTTRRIGVQGNVDEHGAQIVLDNALRNGYHVERRNVHGCMELLRGNGDRVYIRVVAY